MSISAGSKSVKRGRATSRTSFRAGFRKIDQSMLIVSETEQIVDRKNFPLKSRARIFDGSLGGI
jgi:hypothetical protein